MLGFLAVLIARELPPARRWMVYLAAALLIVPIAFARLYLGIHCTALTPRPMSPAGIGTARFFAENIGEPPPIVDGRMVLPAVPGLGFDPQDWWDAQAA